MWDRTFVVKTIGCLDKFMLISKIDEIDEIKSNCKATTLALLNSRQV